MPSAKPATPPGKADLGGAFRWSWSTLTRHPWPMIAPGVLILVAVVLGTAVSIVAAIWMVSPSTVRSVDAYGDSTTTTTTDFQAGGLVLLIVAVLAMIVLVTYLEGSLTAGMLRVADGHPVGVGDFLKLPRALVYLVTMLLITILVLLGTVLLIVPGLIATYAFQFAPILVLEQKLSPTAAMAASARLAFAKKADSILVLLIEYAYGYAGALVMAGMVVALPMSVAFRVHAYRDLVERPIPEQA